MIRINLLETSRKKRQKRQMPSGTPVILLYVLLLIMESMLLYYWYSVKEEALASQTRVTAEDTKKAEKVKKLKAEVEAMSTSMATEEQQAAIFDNLHDATVGPSNIMLYLSYILTQQPAGSQELAVQEEIGWNTQWDADRAWLTDIELKVGGLVTIKGSAVGMNDADEVYNRLKTSVYFQDVSFVEAKRKTSGRDKRALVDFQIDAFYNFDPDVGKVEDSKVAGKSEDVAKEKKK